MKENSSSNPSFQFRLHELNATHARFSQVLHLIENEFDFTTQEGREAVGLLKDSLKWLEDELRRIRQEWVDAGHLE